MIDRLLLELQYGFETTLAYLAGNMGDEASMDNHVREANKVWMELWKIGAVR
jgi:hypothetical protein